MPATRPTLGVSFWPDFAYDASGATTLGVVTDKKGPVLHLDFDVSTFEGPPVCGRTTTVFGVPLPPGIRIDIVPISLRGFLDTSTGECRLDFDARFKGSIFGEGFIALPPMTVRSPLTTDATRGARRSATGSRFGTVPPPSRKRTGEGSEHAARGGGASATMNTSATTNACAGGTAGDVAELVAVASVPKVTGRWDWLMNALLQLPADALAVLPCRLRTWDPSAPRDVETGADDADAHAERSVVRALDDRFEIHAHRRRTGPTVTEEQTTMAMLTFGAATFVEESHQLVL